MFFFPIGSSRWPKSHEGSLLQPRLIDGTGATPLLTRRWSGSDSSLNSEENMPQPPTGKISCMIVLTCEIPVPMQCTLIEMMLFVLLF